MARYAARGVGGLACNGREAEETGRRRTGCAGGSLTAGMPQVQTDNQRLGERWRDAENNRLLERADAKFRGPKVRRNCRASSGSRVRRKGDI